MPAGLYCLMFIKVSRDTMTAEITFANFNPDQHRLEQIGQCDQYPDGVLRGMAAVYGAHIGVAFTEDNLQ